MQIKEMLYDKAKKHQSLYLEYRGEYIDWKEALATVVEIYIIETKQKRSGKERDEILQEVFSAHKELKSLS